MLRMPVPRLKVREENKQIMFLVYKIISQGGLAGKLRLEVPNLDDKALALFLVLFFQLDKLVAIAKLLFSVEMQYESTSSPT
jgi:hypothetical protein